MIVVAIIAILAAIAVPNFLEAQTRSKVARAKADMRAVIGSIEAYRVDNNQYPPDGDDVATFNPMTDFDSRVRLRVITTPIAFITSLPQDPFNVQKLISDDPMTAQVLAVLFPGDPPYTYIYNTFGSDAGGLSPTGILQPANHGRPDNFSLVSLGPNKEYDSVIGYPIIYDPTNGTTSAGDVLRSGGARTMLSTE